MKTNLKTFWKDFAKVPEKCKAFNYDGKDACWICPYSHVCKFLKDFEAELREEKKTLELKDKLEKVGEFELGKYQKIKEILGES